MDNDKLALHTAKTCEENPICKDKTRMKKSVMLNGLIEYYDNQIYTACTLNGRSKQVDEAKNMKNKITKTNFYN